MSSCTQSAELQSSYKNDPLFFWWTHSFWSASAVLGQLLSGYLKVESAPVLFSEAAFLKPALPHPAPRWLQADVSTRAFPLVGKYLQRNLCGKFSILPSEHVSLFSPLRFQSFSDLFMRGFPMCGNLLSSCLPSPGFSYPSQNTLVSFPYLTPMKLTCLSGSLRPSASIQKMFCGSCSTCR